MSGYEEKFKGQTERYDAKPDSDHKEKAVKMDSEDMGMKIHAPKTEALDGAHDKSGMSKAVSHLNRETQRGEHAPTVGGFKHDHTMR